MVGPGPSEELFHHMCTPKFSTTALARSRHQSSATHFLDVGAIAHGQRGSRAPSLLVDAQPEVAQPISNTITIQYLLLHSGSRCWHCSLCCRPPQQGLHSERTARNEVHYAAVAADDECNRRAFVRRHAARHVAPATAAAAISSRVPAANQHGGAARWMVHQGENHS